MAARIEDIRSELQLTSDDISDPDITYAIGKVSGDFNLACAVVLRMLLHKNRGRRQFTLGSFSETVSPQEIRKQIRYYKQQAGDPGMVDIDEPDYIFTVDGI
jgi:hypothetical protein